MTAAHPLEAMTSRTVDVHAHLLERGRGHARVHTAFWEASRDARPDAPVQVCVHGLGGSHLNWALLGPHLTAHGPVWAPDLAGFGYTPPDGRSSSVEDNLDLLTGFIRHVSPDRPVVLIGNSMGGYLSFTLAARHPELVAGLVLVGPAVPPIIDRPDPVVTARFVAFMLPLVGRAYLESRARRLSPAEQVRERMRLCAARPDEVDRRLLAAHVDQTAHRQRLRYTNSAFLTAARSLLLRLGPTGKQAVWRDIDLVSAPTLLVQGCRDRIVTSASSDQLAARRPDWEHRLYADLGHVVMIEDPQRLAEDYAGWRAKHIEAS